MKKIICLILILSFALPLVSCKKSKSFINGTNLKEFSIVYSNEDLDYSKRAAEYIQAEILDRTKLELPLVEDSEKPVTDYEIVVGNTEREISKKLNADTEGLEFAILADEKSVALEGDYFIIAAAAYFFIETYVPSADCEATIPEETKIYEPIVKEAKNFILLIGDGMGYYQTKMFEQIENKAEYSDGEDVFYGWLLPYMGYSRTASLTGVTDSAAGGTALACGTKTYNEHVGKDGDGNDVKNMTELAHELGKSAAVMSTEVNKGATPATFSAHALNRDDSTTIINSQAEAMRNGLIIDCGFNNAFNQRYIKNMEEEHIMKTLSAIDGNEAGFFLMYEEAYIDKHCDDMDMEKAFNAMIRFNQAIGRFMEYAFYNPETMVIITADHETGGLEPDENGVLTFATTEHTGANVPVFAYGKGAEIFDGKEIENIQIAHTLAALMGEENFGDQSVYKSLTK